MAKSKSKKTSLATTILVIVVAGIAAVIAYKQIFLVSQVTSNFPEAKLTRGIEACMQSHLTPNMLKDNLQAMNEFVNVQELLGGVWSQFSNTVATTTVQQNFITEIKVLKIQDFLGATAEMRISGSVDLLSKAPVVGDVLAKKDYMTVVYKRGEAYYFNQLSVKKPESNQWDEWACSQQLQ